MAIPDKHSWLIVLITSLSLSYVNAPAEGYANTHAESHVNPPANAAPFNLPERVSRNSALVENGIVFQGLQLPRIHNKQINRGYPESIQPPGDVTYLFGSNASGYQIYRCEANTEGGYDWALKAPDATLYDDQGNTFGSHYAGPAWQANDGSHIVGELVAKVASPDDANAVAWLLVKVKAWGGDGIFNNVTYVNRVDTEGGQAVKDTCNETRLGDEYQARYSAVYYFYGQP